MKALMVKGKNAAGRMTGDMKLQAEGEFDKAAPSRGHANLLPVECAALTSFRRRSFRRQTQPRHTGLFSLKSGPGVRITRRASNLKLAEHAETWNWKEVEPRADKVVRALKSPTASTK
jgi:hypothetical protein